MFITLCACRLSWIVINLLRPSKLTIIDSDNGLSPERHQAIIWTNVGILLIRTLGTNFSEILSEIQTFSFKKMPLKMSSAKWRPFCLGLNVLRRIWGFACPVYCKARHLMSSYTEHWNRTLTHWGRDKMDAILQTTFWSAFSWIKMFEFRLKFHWSLIQRVQLTIFQHWFR